MPKDESGMGFFYFFHCFFCFVLIGTCYPIESFAIDSKYYTDQYDDDDRAYLLEQERLQKEEKKRKIGERKNGRKDRVNTIEDFGRQSRADNGESEKNTEQDEDGVLSNDVAEKYKNNAEETQIAQQFVDDNFMQLCNFDIKKFCKLKIDRRGYKVKSFDKCKKKLLKNWAVLMPTCQVSLSGNGSATNVKMVNYYVGNGFRVSKTTVDGRVLKRPRRVIKGE